MDLVRTLCAGLVGCLALSCSGQPSPREDVTDDVETVQGALSPSYMQTPMRGHELVTRTALDQLLRRNLLPPVMTTDNTGLGPNWNLIIYGTYFADNPWAGMPGAATLPVQNHMTAPSAGTYSSTSGGFTFDVPLPYPLPNLAMNVYSSASIGWVPGGAGHPSTSLRYSLVLEIAPTNYFIYQDPTVQIKDFALDNFYHYALGDLRDLDVFGTELAPIVDGHSPLSLTLFPLYPWHAARSKADWVTWGPEQKAATQGVVDRVVHQDLVKDADFGAAKYGAILYQVARRFFEGSGAEPDLADLVKVGPTVPGWNGGRMQGHGELNEMQLPTFPHTYLGGMPYVCSGSASADPCAAGQPTWPPWTKLEWGANLPARETPRPGRSISAALIYLGWASHMMQDLAMPHHAANWTGKEHETQDNLGNFLDYYLGEYTDPYTGDYTPAPEYSLETFMQAELDDLLGPVWAPKAKADICRTVGIHDSQVKPGPLGWHSVYPVFLENANRSYTSRAEAIDPAYEKAAGRGYVRNAVLGTIKLLLCAAPTGSSLPEDSNCQRASNAYGIVDNVTWGFAPAEVMSWWVNNGCAASPVSLRTCQTFSDTYGMSPYATSWEFIPSELQSWWIDHQCNTTPSQPMSACQRMSDAYGMDPDRSSGWAPQEAIDWWYAHDCLTTPSYASPGLPENCQHISNHYGTNAGVTWGFATQAVRDYWIQMSCQTAPQN
jgi:hypothetical protein